MTSLRAALFIGLGATLASFAACSDDGEEPAASSSSSSASSGASGSGASGSGGNATGASGVSGGSGGTGGAATGGDGNGGGGGQVPAVDYCRLCGDDTENADVDNENVTEASGIAFSALHDDVLYLHNDSGDDPRFFAIRSTDGDDLGTWDVNGAMANDWEDMARGPCPRGSCLYFGDIGNNSMSSSKPYAIYRVPEPRAVGAGGEVDAEAFPFAYPNGYPNSETLLVHPLTGVITLVTKVRSGPSGIFEVPMPLTPGVEATLVDKGTVSPPMGANLFTGGDVHPQGLGVLLRTYSHTFYFAATPDMSVADALAGPPCVVPNVGGGQIETVAWFPDGSGYAGVPEGDSPQVTLLTCVQGQ